jgi:hypothetical protein
VLAAADRNPGRRYRARIGPPKAAAADRSTAPEPYAPRDPQDAARQDGSHTRDTRATLKDQSGISSTAPATLDDGNNL